MSTIVSDCYDHFADFFLSLSPGVKMGILMMFSDAVRHDMYSYLVRNMTADNSTYVMGYLRSQKHYELHAFIEKLMTQPE
jgi:hypothetical protein